MGTVLAEEDENRRNMPQSVLNARSRVVLLVVTESELQKLVADGATSTVIPNSHTARPDKTFCRVGACAVNWIPDDSRLSPTKL